MNNLSKERFITRKDTFLIIILCLFIVLFTILPKRCIGACYNGLNIWVKSILPVMLPFFFITNILESTSFIPFLAKLFSPITKKLYKVNGISGYVFTIGLLTGYPVTSKLLLDLYNTKKISKCEAIKIASFSSISGPIFVICTLGSIMLNNTYLGILILLVHIVSALINGLIYRNTYCVSTNTCAFTPKTQDSLQDKMLQSIESVMTIGGFICLFFIIIELVNFTHILYPIYSLISLITKIDINTINAVFTGLIELTKGCANLCALSINIKVLFPLLCFLVSFGGLCIITQSLSFLKSFQMPTKLFFMYKFTHAIIALIISIPIALLL